MTQRVYGRWQLSVLTEYEVRRRERRASDGEDRLSVRRYCVEFPSVLKFAYAWPASIEKGLDHGL